MSIEKTNPIPFNTHRYVKRLLDAGIPERLAEILANEQVNLINSNLVTMDPALFNASGCIRRLVDVGMPEQQAEVLADGMLEALNVSSAIRQGLA